MSNPESIEQAQQAPKRNPYTPWFVVAAFVVPVVAAYILFFLGVTPPAYSNRGELLNPVINIKSFALTDAENQPVASDDIIIHRWHMILFAGASCDDACNEALYKMRQINVAVGKNAPRVRHTVVHVAPPDEAFSTLLEQEYPDAMRAYSSSESVEAALQQVGSDFRSNEIYLMDPLGNIMLRFTQDQSYRDLMHDLNKLLKVSQIG